MHINTYKRVILKIVYTHNNIKNSQYSMKLLSLSSEILILLLLIFINCFFSFQRIEGIETLVNLEELFLGQNKITKLENLDTLINLKLLSIQVGKRLFIYSFICFIIRENFFKTAQKIRQFRWRTIQTDIKLTFQSQGVVVFSKIYLPYLYLLKN